MVSDLLLEKILRQAVAKGDYLYFRCEQHGWYHDPLGLPTDCIECTGIGQLVRRTLARDGISVDLPADFLESQARAIHDACAAEDRYKFDYRPHAPQIVVVNDDTTDMFTDSTLEDVGDDPVAKMRLQ